MKVYFPLFLFLLISALFIPQGFCQEDSPLKVAVITGGHEFEQEEFYAMFKTQNIQYTAWEQPAANQHIAEGKAMAFDAIVLYDLWEPISEKEKEGYLAYLKSGKGIVSLHHSLGNYQKWDEFVRIIGGSYVMNEKPRTLDGKTYPASTYKHDIEIPVTIIDTDHPVTKGINDFIIFDEVYGNMLVLDNVHVLLQTNQPLSSPVIGWTNQYEDARIVCLQSGHAASAFKNPNYIKLVRQAIKWVAKRK